MAARNLLRSDGGKLRRVAVVGESVAGLMTTIKLCEAHVPVDLFSLAAVQRSCSVRARDGISASSPTKGEGDSPAIHFEETICGGDFLANQPPVKGMVEAAPNILFMLDRMGVPFQRTAEGSIDLRRVEASRYHRAAFAGTTTGEQILCALERQVRRYQTVEAVDDVGRAIRSDRMVRKLDPWDFVALVIGDDGACVGLVAQDFTSGAIKALPYDAVCLATGGAQTVFGRSIGGLIGMGTAAAKAFRQGAVYANGEFIQVHPTALSATDPPRLVGTGARAEGGRLWVPSDPTDARRPDRIPEKERDYFLERLYPEFGNLVPSDVASHAITQICWREHRGILSAETGKNENEVYLDLTHRNETLVRERVDGFVEICLKFQGLDPCHHPIKVAPAVQSSLGGLWVDYEADADGSLKVGSPRNHATSIPGLYAVGDICYQYGGANRIDADALLSCLFGAMMTGPAIAAYRQSLARSAGDLPSSVWDDAERNEHDDYHRILSQNQDNAHAENVWHLHRELAEVMVRDCTVERDNRALDGALGAIADIENRLRRVRVDDSSLHANPCAHFVRHFESMVELARLIAAGARRRNESRGAHFKPEFPQRQDADWLRTTLARCKKPSEVEFVHSFDYRCAGSNVRVTDEVDVRWVRPRDRQYARPDAAGTTAAAAPTTAATQSRGPVT